MLKWTCLWVFVRRGRRCEEEYCEGWLRTTNSQGSEQDDQLYLLCYRQQAIHPDQLFEWNSSYVFYTNRKKILNTYVTDWLRDIYLKLAKKIFFHSMEREYLSPTPQIHTKPPYSGVTNRYILSSFKLNLISTGEWLCFGFFLVKIMIIQMKDCWCILECLELPEQKAEMLSLLFKRNLTVLLYIYVSGKYCVSA